MLMTAMAPLPPRLGPRRFPQFARLPGEIQLQIWGAACPRPAMHVFDVCVPSLDDSASRTRRAFAGSWDRPVPEASRARYVDFAKTAFLDAFAEQPQPQPEPRAARPDPSMYRWRDTLTRVCGALADAGARRAGRAVNSVYLPGPDRRVTYDNAADVLHLRLNYRATPAAPADHHDGDDDREERELRAGDVDADQDMCQPLVLSDDASSSSRIGQVLNAPWSREMARTVQAARRIALDVADTWIDASDGPLIIEEVVYLASALHHGLEVLYLVDYGLASRGLTAAELQARHGELYRDLHEAADSYEAELSREPDVIHGVGLVYREVFDLEALGWDASHPTYVFARVAADAIRSQQREGPETATFQGLRVLVAEDEDE